MSQIVTDESEGSVFIFPVFGEVGLAAGGGSHTIKNRGGHRFQFGRLCADHVDRNSGRLGKFSDVLRWYYAGIVRAVREHHYDFPTFILSRVFQRQQERVVECRLISGHCRAQGPQNLRPVGSKGGCVGKLSAIRIECDLVGVSQRANELGNRVLREDKAPVHVVTAIKQDKHIGSAHQRGEGLRRGAVRRRFGQRPRRSRRQVPLRKLTETAGWFVAFRKGGRLLNNPILDDGKILGPESRNVVPLLVRDRHVELDHVHYNVEVRALLSFDATFVSQYENQTEQNQQKQFFCHEAPTSATPLALSRCMIGRRLVRTTRQGRTALILAGEANLPSRNSVPVSCIARSSAGQSSKSVAKIFSTIIRVSCGTRWFSMTGEYPPSSARRAQYRFGESQDSARKRLENPERGGMGGMFSSSSP